MLCIINVSFFSSYFYSLELNSSLSTKRLIFSFSISSISILTCSKYNWKSSIFYSRFYICYFWLSFSFYSKYKSDSYFNVFAIESLLISISEMFKLIFKDCCSGDSFLIFMFYSYFSILIIIWFFKLPDSFCLLWLPPTYFIFRIWNDFINLPLLTVCGFNDWRELFLWRTSLWIYSEL